MEASQKKPLSALIDEMGFGLAQARCILLGGGVWLADGAELLLIGTVTEAVAAEWNLSAVQRGLVVTVVFLGILFGNLSSGPISDYFGRRLPICLSYFLIFVFSLLSAGSQSYACLCGARLLVGFSFGLGQPACQALLTEVHPTNWRAFATGGSFVLFSFGEIYSAILIAYDDPYMNDLHWRWLLFMGALPAAFFFGFAILYLQQSPHFLNIQGRYDDCRSVLSSMAKANGVEDVQLDFEPTHIAARTNFRESLGRQASIVFSGRYIASTFIILYSCFVLNFAFYGSLYAFPQIMAEVDMGGTPALQLVMGAVWELVGLAVANAIVILLPRKSAIKVYLGFMVLFLLLFAIEAPRDGKRIIGSVLQVVGYYGIKFVPSTGFLAVYQYVSEIYPTEARASGSALSIAGGRIAGMVSPLLFEMMYSANGNFGVFFYFMAGLCVLNYVLVDCMPYETATMLLKEDGAGGSETTARYGAAGTITGKV